MGQAISVPQDLSNYTTKEELVNKLKAYITNDKLNKTTEDIMKEVDKLYATNTDLESYISKDDFLKELKLYSKTDEINKTFVNKISDKASYSEANNTNNDTYTTPLYWGDRFNANKANLTENDENDNKYITPRFLNERRKIWSVSAANNMQLNNNADDKFPTTSWVSAKMNQQAKDATVSSENDITLNSTANDKFATPGWTSAKINQQKNAWTVSAANDPTLSNKSDEQFATPGWINKKLDSLVATSSALDTLSNEKFVTPRYLSNDRTAKDDSHSDSSFHFATPKYLKDVWLPSQISGTGKFYDPEKLVTGNILEQKVQEQIDANPIVISEKSNDDIATILSSNNQFNLNVSNRLQNSSQIHQGVAEGLTTQAKNANIPRFLADAVAEKVLTFPTLLVGQIAGRLVRNHKGDLTADLPANAITDFETRSIQYIDNTMNRNADFQTAAEEQNTPPTITSGKFGRMDSRIELVNFKNTNDSYEAAKKSHLQITGAAKAFSQTGATRPTRLKRKVKIFDDLLVDNKVAIGPNEDTLPDTCTTQSCVDDGFQLKVGGPALFKSGIETSANTTSRIRGNAHITGKVGIGAEPNSNFDLNVGGASQFTNVTMGSLFVNNSTISNLRNTTLDAGIPQPTIGTPVPLPTMSVTNERATFNRDATFGGGFTVPRTQTARVQGTLDAGIPEVTGTFTPLPTMSVTNERATFNRGAQFNSTLTATGTATFSGLVATDTTIGTLRITNATTGGLIATEITTGTLRITNATTGGLMATGITTGSISATTYSGGALQLSTGITSGSITAITYTGGNMSLSGSANASSYSGGTLQLSTGITTGSISATTYSGGNMSLSGTATFGGAATFRSGFTVPSGQTATVDGILNASGPATFNRTVRVSQTATVDGTLEAGVPLGVNNPATMSVTGTGATFNRAATFNSGLTVPTGQSATLNHINIGTAQTDENSRLNVSSAQHGVNFQRKDGRWTHFDWSDNRNYIRGDTIIDGNTTFSGNTNVTGTTTLDGGGKYVVQDNQDGGSSRGIYLWNKNDRNWGIYMSSSGERKSLNDDTASSMPNITSHAVRFRAFDGNQNGFIFENSNNEALVGINSDTGSTIFNAGATSDLENPNGTLRINRHGIMFGGPNNNRERNSAQITAGMHERDSLNIIGMSNDTNPANRKVTIWSERGMQVYGNLVSGVGANCQRMQSQLTQPGQITFAVDVDSEQSNAFYVAGRNRNGTTFCQRFRNDGTWWRQS